MSIMILNNILYRYRDFIKHNNLSYMKSRYNFSDDFDEWCNRTE